MQGWIEVDTDELRAAGNAMVGVGDGLHATAAKGVLLGKAGYGDAVLSGSAGRFADRFAHLVRGVGSEAIDCGRAMRGSAFEYEEIEAITSRNLDGLGPR